MRSHSSCRRRPPHATWLLCAGLLTSVACQRDEAPDHRAPAKTAAAPAAPPTAWPSASLFHSTARWQSQTSAELSLASLAGEPLVVAMVYTSCRASCPVMMADLKRIEAALDRDERARTRLVVVSFDSRGDTPETLRAFAEEARVDQARWTFLRGEESAVRELAALLDVRFAPLPQGGFDHSNVITLLDANGVIAYRQVGLNQPVEALVERLRAALTAPSGAAKGSS